jgi:3-hydroxy-D-aspartate aldolase
MPDLDLIKQAEQGVFAVERVAETPHLAFAGLQAYRGSAQHLRQWEERRQAIAQATDTAGRIRDLLARHGIECPTVTGAGTFEFEAASGICTVLQCGSYVFMDADYGRNLDRDGARPRPSSRASSSGRR